MNDTGTRQLETENFILRRIVLQDTASVFKLTGDCDVSKYMTWTCHKNIETTENVVSQWIKEYVKADVYRWVIVDKKTKDIVGLINYRDANERHNSIKVSFCTAKKHWNHGIMTEVLQTANEYILLYAGYNRIEGTCDTENSASGRVMQKAGMFYEGIRRDGGKNDDGRVFDISVYSILKSDLKRGMND